jgi:hypothetical protein
MRGHISVQMLNEFSNVMRKKFGATYAELEGAIDELASSFHFFPIDVSTVKLAYKVGERYGFSYYDSLVVASALQCDCVKLFRRTCKMDRWLMEGSQSLTRSSLEFDFVKRQLKSDVGAACRWTLRIHEEIEMGLWRAVFVRRNVL